MKSFRTFSELESHLDIGDHCVKEERQSETLYDKLRRDWVDMFTTSVNITKDGTCTPGSQQNVSSSPPSDQAVRMGWALPKPRAGSLIFTDKVKNHLTTLASRPGVKRTLNRCPAICGKQQMSKTIGSLTEKIGWQKAKWKVFFPALLRVDEGSKIPQKSILLLETYCGRKKKLIDSSS